MRPLVAHCHLGLGKLYRGTGTRQQAQQHLTTAAFKTAGHGVLEASGVDGLQRGAVIWEVTEGRGQFAGATGLITSNFTVGRRARSWTTTTFVYSCLRDGLPDELVLHLTNHKKRSTARSPKPLLLRADQVIE
jgi:hypothetical protein